MMTNLSTPMDEPLCEHGNGAWHCTICGEIATACAATLGYYAATVPITAENTTPAAVLRTEARAQIRAFNTLTSPTTLHINDDGSTVESYASRAPRISRAKGRIQAVQDVLAALVAGLPAALDRATAQADYYARRLEAVGLEENRPHLESLLDGYRACRYLLALYIDQESLDG